jgi:hypothetical protein
MFTRPRTLIPNFITTFRMWSSELYQEYRDMNFRRCRNLKYQFRKLTETLSCLKIQQLQYQSPQQETIVVQLHLFLKRISILILYSYLLLGIPSCPRFPRSFPPEFYIHFLPSRPRYLFSNLKQNGNYTYICLCLKILCKFLTDSVCFILRINSNFYI